MKRALLLGLSLVACGGPLEILDPPGSPFADHDLLVVESTCPALGDRCDQLLRLSFDLPPVVLVAPESAQWLEDADLSGSSLAITRWSRRGEGTVGAEVEVITSVRGAARRSVIAPGTEPALSPDGTLVALTAPADGGVELRQLDGTLTRLLLAGGGAHGARFSPDGEELVLVGGPSNQLWRAGARTGPVTPVSGLFGVLEVRFSPSGDRLLVATEAGVYLLDRDLEERTPLPRLSGSTFRWSPSGDALAFLGAPQGGRSPLLLSAPAGASPRALTDVVVWGHHAWSPDGDWLAYSSGATTWVVRREDGERVPVHESDGAQRDPLWLY